MLKRRALVTGATGFIGSHLVPRLLQDGWRVKVLTRHADSLPETWRDDTEVVEGDAGSVADLEGALRDVDCAFYLIHSMDGQGNYQERDRRIADTFATVALEEKVGRIIYLSGLHPEGVALSEHMKSRVEVGQRFLTSGVPTAVLQAAVVLGQGSASFEMLRHLTERLPVMVAPKWINNLTQPIFVEDVVFYLAAATDLPPEVNRTIDIGMDEILTYREMMQRYAAVAELHKRIIVAVPVLTPALASRWVGLVTPVKAGIAKPLVGSLIEDSIKRNDDALELLGEPDTGITGFDEAIRRSIHDIDPKQWGTFALGLAIPAVAAAIAALTLATKRQRH